MGLFSDISPGNLILWALMLLVLPMNWLLAAAFAAMIHELSHVAAIRLTGGRVLGLRVSGLGLRLDTGPMSRLQELLCAAAGPAGSLMLYFLLPVFPRVGLCGIFQGLFNLIPVYPMDGGRILRCLMLLLLPRQQGEILYSVCQLLLSGVLWGLLLWAFLRTGRVDCAVFAGCFLLFRLGCEKFVAKRRISG